MGGPREREVSGSERHTLLLLGVPTLALALSATVVTTYLPVAAQAFLGSTIVIGVIIGFEGIVALWLPLLVGTWSDRLRTDLGGRLPFLIAAAPVIVVGLVAMSLVNSAIALAITTFVFFIGYFTAYEPYRALYPDAVPADVAGRAQSTQAAWRGAGTGLALLGGGLLVAVSPSLPFLAAAALFVAALVAFVWGLRRRGIPDREQASPNTGVGEAAREVWSLIRDNPALRAFLVANALWELSLAALKTFVVLYVTQGLGFSQVSASAIIGGVAVIVLLAALGAGRLADRFGHHRVMSIGAPVYGAGFLVPFLFSSPLAIAIAMPFIAIGGGVIMALPFALLTQLMPGDGHGALTGYYSFSRGLGTWFGPLLGGAAITALAGVFTATKGYQAVWGVCAVAVLASMLPLRALRSSS